MKNKKLKKRLFAIAVAVIVGLLLDVQTGAVNPYESIQTAIFDMFHEHEYQSYIVEPTCRSKGYERHFCQCGDEYNDNYVDALPHDWKEWELTTLPTPNENGQLSTTCSVCDKLKIKEYICPHEELEQFNIKDPSCTEEGTIHENCVLCKKLINEIPVPMLEHTFGDWKITKSATPLESGTRAKSCEGCGLEKSESYNMSFGSKSIYIPGVFNATYVVGGFTQAAVDNNDIVLNYDRLNYDNPIVLGHSHRTMGPLYRTKIGQYIYLARDGRIDVYKVIISERAMDNGYDLVGDSGTPLIKSNYDDVLRLYTCYDNKTVRNRRWIVIAEKAS